MSLAIEQRIDQIESRFAMHELVSNYCHGFDKRDWQRFLDIWWEDARWDIGPPFGNFEGHDGITRATKEILWEAWDYTSHFTTNLIISFDGTNHANGICNVDCIGRTSDGQAQTISATYHDRFERRDGHWKIAYRKVQMHHFNPLPGVQLSPPE